jgi:hypothetical protein
VRFALIGAAAMAAHGVSRSTLDQDLLVMDPRVLDAAFWKSTEAAVDARRGDGADPLAGVVRLNAPGERPVDIVVGRGAWMSKILSRAPVLAVPGGAMPVADPADLILLKLYAGGSQDLWDVQQLLAASPDPVALRSTVNDRLADGPPASRAQWERATS